MGLHKRKGNAHKSGLSAGWYLPLTVLGVSAVMLLGGDLARDWLRYERSDIASGELWRLLSGHFVHLGLTHFLLNAAGLGLVWYLVGNAFRSRQWGLVLCFSVLAIDLGFWFLNPQLQWYVGLSGVLHGLLVAGLVVCASSQRRDLLVVIALVVSKIAYEQVLGPLPGSAESSGGAVIVDAHFYGAVAGLVAGTLQRIRVLRSAPI